MMIIIHICNFMYVYGMVNFMYMNPIIYSHTYVIGKRDLPNIYTCKYV